mmetsp:Transcript_23669/g.51102  ORF Transcript_23669/g.51102 Transcript_23669/m.51102 type:complete len:95 (+) Transcript_23669:83-367(+)
MSLLFGPHGIIGDQTVASICRGDNCDAISCDGQAVCLGIAEEKSCDCSVETKFEHGRTWARKLKYMLTRYVLQVYGLYLWLLFFSLSLVHGRTT